MKLDHGILTISLDFELYWGMRDKRSIEQYKDNLLGVRKAVPEILRLFRGSDIHATWATVGFLFFNDKAHLRDNVPELVPTYRNAELSPYHYMQVNPELDPQYHFAPELIAQIAQQAGQEIGTHTFSHYYCLEQGQSFEQFKADLRAAVKTAQEKNIALKSLVFPRNQWNTQYLPSLPELGIKAFRGNESSWIYRASDEDGQSTLRRAVRLTDAYVNLSGHHTYGLSRCTESKPYSFPASRFLRPYSKKLAPLEGLRLQRIKNAMSFAAKNKEIFHLWWHPHNFGVNTEQNLDFLAKIFAHYEDLRATQGMQSLNMGELSALAESGNGT